MTDLLSHATLLLLVSFLCLQPVEGLTKERGYTQNSLCRQNYCTNPIFPGLNDLPRLEALQWQCSSVASVSQYMDFCKDAVLYDPALPSPVKAAKPITELVKAQEDAAMTMFVYHLNGMGYDAWDYRQPSQSDNDCVRSVWKMTCNTYFPRAEAGCKAGEQSSYKRPCMNSCHNYIKTCGVECCDESVQCTFSHTSTNSSGATTLLQSGYVEENGPSAACTGGAKQSMSAPWMLLLAIFGLQWVAADGSSVRSADHVKAKQPSRGVGKYCLMGVIGILALSLQGCSIAVPHHVVGNWRTKTNYLTEFAFNPPTSGPEDKLKAVLNSCNHDDIPSTLKCGGRGYCKSFSTDSIAAQQSTSAGSKPLSFCQCERDWADPECGTRRKSQRTAFFLSTFLGFTGADYFYLGYPLWGVGKLCTLGGLGFWWLLDIVRTGAGPVYAHNFRVASDLPHWIAVIIMIFVCMLSGFMVAIENFMSVRRKKRLDMASLNNKEEARKWQNPSEGPTEEELKGLDGPRFRTKHTHGGPPNFSGRPGFCGYGATLPVSLPSAGCAYATPGTGNGPFGPAGTWGEGSPTPNAIRTEVAPTHMGLQSREATMPRDNFFAA